MAVTKKKAGVKKKVKPNGGKKAPLGAAVNGDGTNGQKHILEATKVESAVAVLESTAGDMDVLLEKIGSKVIFPQAMIRIADCLGKVAKLADKARKAFDEHVKKHRTDGGEFEKGALGLLFDDSTRRTPAWKDECVDRAEKLAQLQGESWDQKVFLEGVLDAYPVKAYTRVKVVQQG